MTIGHEGLCVEFGDSRRVPVNGAADFVDITTARATAALGGGTQRLHGPLNPAVAHILAFRVAPECKAGP